LNFLQTGGFQNAALPMTPKDSIEMYNSMVKVFPEDAIADLHPSVFFQECVSGLERMTLERTKEYEDSLKNKLVALSFSHPEETQLLLADYDLEDGATDYNICDLVLDLKFKNMTPCLLFHLNVFELISLFQRLVEDLEARELLKYPDHYKDSDVKVVKNESKKKGQGENQKELERAKQDGLVANDGEKRDKTQPHKDFSFLPEGPISVTEFENICKDVAERDNFIGDIKEHALMRALKRGIGFYIDDHHFTAYRVAVMTLAMQGKLGVVFSD
jgi:hypothetical protein